MNAVKDNAKSIMIKWLGGTPTAEKRKGEIITPGLRLLYNYFQHLCFTPFYQFILLIPQFNSINRQQQIWVFIFAAINLITKKSKT